MTYLSNQHSQNEKCVLWKLPEANSGAEKIPQRKVAHRLDIDTSTLSKIELGERQINVSMIEGLADVLGLEYKELQIKFISEKILNNFHNQPF